MKKAAMLEAINIYFPASARCTNPQGGLFIWVELPQTIDAVKLMPKAIERKVAYVTGNAFFADGRGQNTLRLNYSNATVEQIERGIKSLGDLLKEEPGIKE